MQPENKTEKFSKTPPHRVNLKSSYHLLTEQIREAKKALFGLTNGEESKIRKYATQKKIKNIHQDCDIRQSQNKKATPTRTTSKYYSRALPEFPAQSRPSYNNVAGSREAVNYSPRNEESPNFLNRDISAQRIKRTEKYHHQPRQLHEKGKTTGAVQLPSEMKRRFKQPQT